MRYRQFGGMPWKVSEVGMGCWELSGVSRGGGMGYGSMDDRTAIRLVHRAVDLGINFFDTADAYGVGHSEVVIGRALKELSEKPGVSVPYVATKGGNNFYVQPWKKSFDREYLKNACENSLQRLGLDCVDLYQMHGPGVEVIRDGEMWDALEELKKEGKIKAYGISIMATEEGVAALEAAPGLDALMCTYNILEQENAVFFPTALEKGVAIIARSPLATGRLTGAFTRDTEFEEGDYRTRFGKEWVLDAVEKAERLGFLVKGDTASLAQAALKFILAQEAVAVAVPGPKTLAELEDNVRTAESTPLSSEDLAKLRELTDQGLLGSRPSRV